MKLFFVALLVSFCGHSAFATGPNVFCDVEAMHVKADGSWDKAKARDYYEHPFTPDNYYIQQSRDWQGAKITFNITNHGCASDGSSCTEGAFEVKVGVSYNGVESDVTGRIDKANQGLHQSIKIADKLFWISCENSR